MNKNKNYLREYSFGQGTDAVWLWVRTKEQSLLFFKLFFGYLNFTYLYNSPNFLQTNNYKITSN